MFFRISLSLVGIISIRSFIKHLHQTLFDAVVLKRWEKNLKHTQILLSRGQKFFLSSMIILKPSILLSPLTFLAGNLTFYFIQRFEDIKLESHPLKGQGTALFRLRRVALPVFLVVSYPASTKTWIIPFSLDCFWCLLFSIFLFLSAYEYSKASLLFCVAFQPLCCVSSSPLQSFIQYISFGCQVYFIIH